jgi:hypothetical protein
MTAGGPFKEVNADDCRRTESPNPAGGDTSDYPPIGKTAKVGRMTWPVYHDEYRDISIAGIGAARYRLGAEPSKDPVEPFEPISIR